MAPTQRREAELEVAELRITRRGRIRSEFIGGTAQAEQLEKRRCDSLDMHRGGAVVAEKIMTSELVHGCNEGGTNSANRK